MKLKNFHFSALFILFTNILFVAEAYSQSYPRTMNPAYTQTKLFEDFSSGDLNRTTWQVVSDFKKDNLYIFTDSSATVKQNNNNLELSMLRHPGYSATVWSPNGDTLISARFIAGEVMTIDDYSYGIFECNATFAPGRGSFPAFWLYNDTMCFESERPEIDIVELKVNRRKPTLDNNIWYYPVDCQPHTSHEFTRHPFSWGGTHTFKGIWTPEKIEFWVDNTLLKEVYNNGQHWYPRLRQHVILSQQIIRYGRCFPDSAKIETPQTSRFHWVKVKEFFLAPEIFCPGNITTSVIATLDVDNAASEITWELTPERLFAGATYGRGINAVINPATSLHGKGRLIYRFKMPSGETFFAEKKIILNGLYEITDRQVN